MQPFPMPLSPAPCTVEVICVDECIFQTGKFVLDFTNDSFCDDGGNNSFAKLCGLGKDCSDCGPRLACNLLPEASPPPTPGIVASPEPEPSPSPLPSPSPSPSPSSSPEPSPEPSPESSPSPGVDPEDDLPPQPPPPPQLPPSPPVSPPPASPPPIPVCKCRELWSDVGYDPNCVDQRGCATPSCDSFDLWCIIVETPCTTERSEVTFVFSANGGQPWGFCDIR